MKYQKSAGCIVFREAKSEKNKRLYLLLYCKASDHYKENWGFPKGWVEKGEELTDTAKRETAEEAGITKLQFFPGFREKVHYIFKHNSEFISKDAYYFLAKTTQKKVKLSSEHDDYKWLTYEDALTALTNTSAKAVLKKAEEYLEKDLKHNLDQFL